MGFWSQTPSLNLFDEPSKPASETNLLLLVLIQFIQLPAGALFPDEPWISAGSRSLADTYYSCRRHNVEGVMEVATEAELRANVASMLYDQRVECRSHRRRLLRSLDTDVRGNRRQRGDSERVLDAFERNIDARVQSMFSSPEP